MTDPYTWHARPSLDAPILVVMLAGWIDAGGAAALAMSALDEQLGARTVVSFDQDTFIDYRARRPAMELREGVSTRLVWPTIELRAGRDPAGHDALLLTGYEPDSAWRAFVAGVGSLCETLGVAYATGLGAYPIATPHTRPGRVSITTPDPELAGSLPYLRNSVDVPAGIEAALEHDLHGRGIPAVGLWAQVPHYVATMPYPAATVALLQAVSEVTGLVVDTDALTSDAAEHGERLDELVAQNPEHLALLRQLEQLYDAAAQEEQAPGLIGPTGLPSGDELAAELERFLRDQGGRGGAPG